MIPKKIKEIRLFLGISAIQVSSIIIENSYKYKRCESDTDYLTTEMLILLSVIYKVPFEMFVSNEYTIADILANRYLVNLKELEPEQIELLLKDNLCSYFNEKRKKANKATIDLLLRNERRLFKDTLQLIKENLDTSIYNIEEVNDIFNTINSLLKIKTAFPSINQIADLSNKLNIPVNCIITVSKEK